MSNAALRSNSTGSTPRRESTACVRCTRTSAVSVLCGVWAGTRSGMGHWSHWCQDSEIDHRQRTALAFSIDNLSSISDGSLPDS